MRFPTSSCALAGRCTQSCCALNRASHAHSQQAPERSQQMQAMRAPRDVIHRGACFRFVGVGIELAEEAIVPWLCRGPRLDAREIDAMLCEWNERIDERTGAMRSFEQ